MSYLLFKSKIHPGHYDIVGIESAFKWNLKMQKLAVTDEDEFKQICQLGVCENKLIYHIFSADYNAETKNIDLQLIHALEAIQCTDKKIYPCIFHPGSIKKISFAKIPAYCVNSKSSGYCTALTEESRAVDSTLTSMRIYVCKKVPFSLEYGLHKLHSSEKKEMKEICMKLYQEKIQKNIKAEIAKLKRQETEILKLADPSQIKLDTHGYSF